MTNALKTVDKILTNNNRKQSCILWTDKVSQPILREQYQKAQQKKGPQFEVVAGLSVFEC